MWHCSLCRLARFARVPWCVLLWPGRLFVSHPFCPCRCVCFVRLSSWSYPCLHLAGVSCPHVSWSCPLTLSTHGGLLPFVASRPCAPRPSVLHCRPSVPVALLSSGRAPLGQRHSSCLLVALLGWRPAAVGFPPRACRRSGLSRIWCSWHHTGGATVLGASPKGPRALAFVVLEAHVAALAVRGAAGFTPQALGPCFLHSRRSRISIGGAARALLRFCRLRPTGVGACLRRSRLFLPPWLPL